MNRSLNCGILIVSDRSAEGIRPDRTGQALQSQLEAQGWAVSHSKIVPDEVEDIRSVLEAWADELQLDLVLTSGGTGLSPRDVTPDATMLAADRLVPGIAEAMRADSLHITPHAMLSRAVAAVRGHTLIINLPGSPKGAQENLEYLLPVLPHAVQLITHDPEAEAGHIRK